uniref:Uncharacterized protein n=1 Tax=Lepeophtheirus salmonis TaxID=72036 RepID=A0A0K2VJJ4_LEPSM
MRLWYMLLLFRFSILLIMYVFSFVNFLLFVSFMGVSKFIIPKNIYDRHKLPVICV